MLALALGCDDSAGTSSPAGDAAVDLRGDAAAEACPGFSSLTQTGSCAGRAGTGWLGDFCFPDHFTYCACLGGRWSCCGDQPPECEPTPPANGESCCPGAGPTYLGCDYRSDGGVATHCACGAELRWRC